MKLIDIQDEFLNYGKKLNFNLLKEGNVVRPDGSETFLICLQYHNILICLIP